MDSPATPMPKSSFTCFVIMPFSDTAHEIAGAKKTTSAAEWTNIYQDWIKKAVESYPNANISCERSATAAGNFVKGIVGSLNDSSFVIADLTGNKPNVYYELGIRHALRTGTIIITQHRSALPSDLQTYYCLEYTYSSAHFEYTERFSDFEGQIHDLIKTIIAQNFSSDSPVSDFMGYTSYSFVNEWRKEHQDFIDHVKEFSRIEKLFREQATEFITTGDIDSFRSSNLFEIDLCISKFYHARWTLTNVGFIEGFRKVMFGFRITVAGVYDLLQRIEEVTHPIIEYVKRELQNYNKVASQLEPLLQRFKNLEPPAR